jgi:hypothetical protein
VGTSKQRTWKIYEVEDSAIVSALRQQPVVMKGVTKAGKTWLKPSEAWYLNPSNFDVFYAATGPKNWARIPANDMNPPRTSLQPVQVANIKSGDDNVSFDVDTIGVPVLVKVSYFPDWHVSGAKGPYRVTPNLMVVVPTSHHVRLHYGYTPLDLIGYLLSFLGIIGVIYLIRAKPVHMPLPVHFARAGGPPAPESDSSPAPFYRLEHELAGAFPPSAESPAGGQTDQDLDVWLGFPAGLDLARYRTSDYGRPPRHGNGSGSPDGAPATGEVPVVDPGAPPPPAIDVAWMGPYADGTGRPTDAADVLVTPPLPAPEPAVAAPPVSEAPPATPNPAPTPSLGALWRKLKARRR